MRVGYETGTVFNGNNVYLRGFVFVGPYGNSMFVDPFGGNAGLFANVVGNVLEQH